MKLGEDGRGRVEEEVYGFWVDQGRGVVVSSQASDALLTSQDLWYWTWVSAFPHRLLTPQVLPVQLGQGGRRAWLAGEPWV